MDHNELAGQQIVMTSLSGNEGSVRGPEASPRHPCVEGSSAVGLKGSGEVDARDPVDNGDHWELAACPNLLT